MIGSSGLLLFVIAREARQSIPVIAGRDLATMDGCADQSPRTTKDRCFAKPGIGGLGFAATLTP
jgi:hypothetical protein